MKAILFVTALALVGCSKKSEESSSGGDPCGAAINSAVDKMVASRKDAPPEMTEIANKLRTLMTQHCRDDKWPADVIACFSGASDQPSIKKCRQQLSPELAQKLQTDIMKVMSAGADARQKAREHMGSGGGGGMGMGGHGGDMGAHGGMGGGSGGGAGGGAPAGSGGAGGAPAGSGSADTGSGSAK